MSALSGNPSYSVDPAATAQYWKTAVQTPMLREFDLNVKPRIAEGFAGLSGFSSRQGQAQARALTDMTVAGNAQLANWQQQNQSLQAQLNESARARQMQGVGLANSLAMQPLYGASALQQFGMPYQQRADALNAAQYGEFQRTALENNPWLNTALNYVGQTKQIAYNTSNPIGGALGGALGGGAMGMAAGFGSMVNPFLGLGALAGAFL